jgi:hypothetical protein
MSNKKLLALIIGIPLVIWGIGFCLDAFYVTGNLVTPLTKGVLDFWLIAALCYFVYRIFKRKKQTK